MRTPPAPAARPAASLGPAWRCLGRGHMTRALAPPRDLLCFLWKFFFVGSALSECHLQNVQFTVFERLTATHRRPASVRVKGYCYEPLAEAPVVLCWGIGPAPPMGSHPLPSASWADALADPMDDPEALASCSRLPAAALPVSQTEAHDSPARSEPRLVGAGLAWPLGQMAAVTPLLCSTLTS